MRHVYTSRVVCLISALLAGAAVLWAWRQRRPSVALQHAASPVVTSAEANASARGREVYARACIACHASDDAPHGRLTP